MKMLSYQHLSRIHFLKAMDTPKEQKFDMRIHRIP